MCFWSRACPASWDLSPLLQCQPSNPTGTRGIVLSKPSLLALRDICDCDLFQRHMCWKYLEFFCIYERRLWKRTDSFFQQAKISPRTVKEAHVILGTRGLEDDDCYWGLKTWRFCKIPEYSCMEFTTLTFLWTSLLWRNRLLVQQEIGNNDSKNKA